MKNLAALLVGIACAAALSVPVANADPSPQYFQLPWSPRCQVSVAQVSCEQCPPGRVINAAATCSDPAPEMAFNALGKANNDAPVIASFPDAQPILSGQTYHANGWTITIVDGWARFTNDATGHGYALAPQNLYSF